MRHCYVRTIAILVFLTVSYAGLAQYRPYAGVGLGVGTAKLQCPDGNCSQTSIAYKFFGGINFNKIFSVELSYMDFGKSHGNGTLSNGTSFDAAVHTRAIGATIGREFFILPRISIRPAIGVSSNFASLKYPSYQDDNLSKANLTYLAAVSLDYRFTANWDMRVQGDFTQTKPYKKPGTATLLSIGVVYNF